MINLNQEKAKNFSNSLIVSTNGFVYTVTIVLLRLLDQIGFYKNYPRSPAFINHFFSITNNSILFKKLDRLYSEDVKELILNESSSYENIDYDHVTCLFFSIHCCLSYILKPLLDDYFKVIDAMNVYIDKGQVQDPKL